MGIPTPTVSDGRPKRHFVNLTNGLEWVDELPEFSFVRVSSTDIEKGNWFSILRDLDVNLLMSLALGHECHFYDCGTGRQNSKTVTKGVPMIVACLTYLWVQGGEFRADTPERQALKRKLSYFRRYLNTDKIKLIGHSRMTKNDGDKPYYRRLAVRI